MAMFPLKALLESLLCFSQPVVAPGILGLWQHYSRDHFHLHMAISRCLGLYLAFFRWSVSKYPSSCKDSSHTSWRVNLTWANLQRPFLQIKSHSQVLGIRMSICLFMVHKVQPTAVSLGWTQSVSRAGHFSGSCGEEFTFKLTQTVGRIQLLTDVGLKSLPPCWLQLGFSSQRQEATKIL